MTTYEIIVLQCNQCGRKERMPGDGRMHPPAGWHNVRSRASAGAAIKRDFCSRDCLLAAYQSTPTEES